MKKLVTSIGIFFALTACAQEPLPTILNPTPTVTPVDGVQRPKIQVSLLLDTSNSMDGLIDQAKARLWNIVNTLTTLKYEGETPDIEISLYEYGNSRLTVQSGYIRQVTPLTTDLDLISANLFGLRTNGGDEYCGAVILDATRNLKWDNHPNTMKLVYIAGNEPFNQGSVHYKEAISEALGKGIYINTIHCGDYNEGIRTFWQDGAISGNGKYFNIDSNRKIQHIDTPYDKEIVKCNERMNNTYIGYGSMGREKKTMQATQDANAASVSGANYTERIVSKSKAAYKNESWDLVDKVKNDQSLDDIKEEELPQELQNKSKEELAKIINEKTKERETIQKEIAELNKKRQAYIEAEKKKSSTNEDDLGSTISSTIIEVAKKKGFEIEG
jgi:Skp family chaperone for outer membrane proteins